MAQTTPSFWREAMVASVGALIGGAFTFVAIFAKDPDVYLHVGLPLDRGADRIVTLTLANQGRGLAEDVELFLNPKLPPASLGVQKVYGTYMVEPKDQRQIKVSQLRIREEARFYVEYPTSIDLPAKEVIDRVFAKNCSVKIRTNEDRISEFAAEKQRNAFVGGVFFACVAAAIGVAISFAMNRRKTSRVSGPSSAAGDSVA